MNKGLGLNNWDFDIQKINDARAKVRNRILHELAAFGTDFTVSRSFEIWYEKLLPFRRHVSSLICASPHKFTTLNPWMIDRHRIDHHIHALLSPLPDEIFRNGMGANTLTPVEQLVEFSRQFTDRGIRFIYAALPCKKTIYPQLLLRAGNDCEKIQEIIASVPNVVPQWRKMLFDISKSGIEIIDFLPIFMRTRNDIKLFPAAHWISLEAMPLIGSVIAQYLKETTKYLPQQKGMLECRKVRINEDGEIWDARKILIKSLEDDSFIDYQGTRVESEIGIFGNCNLQHAEDTGLDITSHVAFHCGYPVTNCGRLLPFLYGSTSNIAQGVFHGKKIVIYLGFPSAAYVRARNVETPWTMEFFSNMLFQERNDRQAGSHKNS